ncbi:MAG TPA: hypothetical protein VMC84_00235 [Methanocella sp.]|uniref:hypothetical protein n=1 Tax=Methanocella sp. TaxID=2052833 RepID=UPI002C7BF598|nr:hypothetical protein [Methanocella sp.]HTY89583.1 hypothetical protein [Methanocella sp.]
MDTIIFYIAAGAACIIIFSMVYRSLKAPFFLYLSAAAIFMACGSISTVPGAGALSGLSMALGGASMAAASLQLTCSFRLAGDEHD